MDFLIFWCLFDHFSWKNHRIIRVPVQELVEISQNKQKNIQGVSKVRGYTNPTNPAGLRQDYPGLGHLSLD